VSAEVFACTAKEPETIVMNTLDWQDRATMRIKGSVIFYCTAMARKSLTRVIRKGYPDFDLFRDGPTEPEFPDWLNDTLP
jgi:hypothetical protein